MREALKANLTFHKPKHTADRFICKELVQGCRLPL